MLALLQQFVLFAEPGFPSVDAPPLPAIPEAIETRTVAELTAALKPGRVLVWRHGGALPAEAWKPIRAFLEQGGGLLHLGGEPWTQLALGPAGQRRLDPPQVQLLKDLRLNQRYRLEVGGAELSGDSVPRRALPIAAQVFVLEPRLCDTKDFAHEDGAPGSRDALVRPLAHVRMPEADRRFPAACGALAIDHLLGRFAGGRWVFWLLTCPPTAAELTTLLAEARRPVLDLRVDPSLGCYHEGERPSVHVRVHRPKAQDVVRAAVKVQVEGPGALRAPLPDLTLAAAEHGELVVPLDLDARPGLYKVRVEAVGLGSARTGFWVMDPALFAGGDALSFDGFTLLRNGRPEPVVGTTTMSATVHRKFLFEPDAATWDDTFAELRALGINMVRTGMWSAWRKITLDPNVIDEAWLRALEAYYLSARKHGIPILFTFFAFLPEDFAGQNPFLDPRAVSGQKAFVAAVARRFAGTKEMLWDLINEPSFSSSRKLWRCRPNDDPQERRAFQEWLRQRFGKKPADPEDKSFEEVVRRRWRLRPDEEIGLPGDEDFTDRWLYEERRPFRAQDFVLFAQDAFGGWIREMTQAIRSAGSTAAITVGQDEGGVGNRPNPLFHHGEVQFTSMHTWWNHDALLWDAVLARGTGKPLLVSETGIMQRESLAGEAFRTPDQFARVLSRKLALAFAAGAFGVVQWCYEVNPFMASDNEVAIGLRRTDGSFKPEHAELRAWAGFCARNRDKLAAPAEPDVVLLVPSSDWFSSRDTMTGATRRAVDVLQRDLLLRVRAVVDARADQDLGQPRAIVMPACRGLPDAAWAAVIAAVENGATLLCSGWFETDECGHPAARLGATRRPLGRFEPLRDAPAAEFSGTLPEAWYATEGEPVPRRTARGKGAILHHPLPLEWAERSPALAAFYRQGLTDAGVVPLCHVQEGIPPGVLITLLPRSGATALVLVNESAVARTVVLTARDRVARLEVHVPAGAGRMWLLAPDDWRILDATHSSR